MTRIYNVQLRKHYTKDHQGNDVDNYISESRTVAVVDGWAEDAITKAKEISSVPQADSKAEFDSMVVVTVTIVAEAE